jgi:hypothetical protein
MFASCISFSGVNKNQQPGVGEEEAALVVFISTLYLKATISSLQSLLLFCKSKAILTKKAVLGFFPRNQDKKTINVSLCIMSCRTVLPTSLAYQTSNSLLRSQARSLVAFIVSCSQLLRSLRRTARGREWEV